MTAEDKSQVINFLFKELDMGILTANTDLDCSPEELNEFLENLHTNCIELFA